MSAISREFIAGILALLNKQGIGLAAFLIEVVKSNRREIRPYYTNFVDNLPTILSATWEESTVAVRTRMEGYRDVCVREMKQLSSIHSGFHFGATKLNTSQLDVFKLSAFVTKY
jgi:hypothetical protein